MKTKFLLALAALALSAGAFAKPLTQIIFEESERLARKVAAFNKQCSHADSFSGGNCMDKRYALSGELGKFVALVNDGLSFLDSGGEQTAQDEQTNARRKDMQLQRRAAIYWMTCLGRDYTTECKAEKAALDAENYPFGREGLAAP